MRTLITATAARVRSARRHMRDRGQNMLEYVGLVIIVAGVIVGLSGVLGGIKDPFDEAVQKVTTIDGTDKSTAEKKDDQATQN